MSFNKKNIYLDYSATTPLDKDVFLEMKPYLENYYGNASSIYSISAEPKMAIDIARGKIAKAINCKREEVFFTSGGTESDNWTLIGTAFANKDKGKHIITSSIEHHAILNSCKFLQKNGFRVTYINPNKDGIIEPAKVKKAICDDTILVSIMMANNEIGTIEPIREIGEICREKNILFHTDAVQAAGHISIDVEKMNVNMLSMSAHKFYGPKGVGILYVQKGTKIESFMHGGEQERGKRAGTENTPGIVGIAKALEISVNNIKDESKRLENLRNMLIKGLLEIEGTKLNGTLENRLPSNINICFNGVETETLLMALDLRGICASAGSACSAGSLDPSHVLLAIGLTEDEAKSSMRFSIGKYTTEDEIKYTIETVKDIIKNIRK